MAILVDIANTDRRSGVAAEKELSNGQIAKHSRHLDPVLSFPATLLKISSPSNIGLQVWRRHLHSRMADNPDLNEDHTLTGIGPQNAIDGEDGPTIDGLQIHRDGYGHPDEDDAQG